MWLGAELSSQSYAVSALLPWRHVIESYHEGREFLSSLVAALGVSPWVYQDEQYIQTAFTVVLVGSNIQWITTATSHQTESMTSLGCNSGFGVGSDTWSTAFNCRFLIRLTYMTQGWVIGKSIYSNTKEQSISVESFLQENFSFFIFSMQTILHLLIYRRSILLTHREIRKIQQNRI